MRLGLLTVLFHNLSLEEVLKAIRSSASPRLSWHWKLPG